MTDLVNGHMAYRTAIPKLLRRVGWEVESDEFSEIEDPDPDNHEGRHRELIREIEDARKEAEKPEKGRFAFFKRKKAPDKKKWETYDESSTKEADPKGDSSADRRSSKTLFDIDAIRAELESEQMQVREIESTLPPMRLDLNQHTRDRSQTDAIPQNTFSPTPLHTSKSMGDAPSLAVPPTYDSQSASLLTSGRATPRLDDDDEQFHTPPANANVSMSFDHPKTRSDEQPLPSPLPSAALPSAVLAWRSTTPVSEATPARPEIKSANSMPAAVPTQHEPIRLDHNAWADEEEEWGKEREMVMSFE